MNNKLVTIVSIISINILLMAFLLFYYFDKRNESTVITEKTKTILSKNQHIYYQNPFGSDHIDLLKKQIDNGSVVVVDKNNQVLLNYYGDSPFIPASTLKVVTSAAALHYLGKDFRFSTEFRIDAEKNLYIKGFGDPSHTSEELRYLISRLKAKGLKEINSIYLDGTYFIHNAIIIRGNDKTYAAYEARNSALSANFNTIAFKRTKKSYLTHDKKTPLISYAIELIKTADKNNRKQKKKYERMSLQNEQDILLYYGHLFKELCKETSITTKAEIKIKQSPEKLPVFYRHDSKPLSEIVVYLLKFSNNFTANQILLSLGAQKKGAPATIQKGLGSIDLFLRTDLKIDNMIMTEGSGLSYANRVTGFQMMTVLDYFQPYKALLKNVKVNGKICGKGKTGGLRLVRSLVGYLESPRIGEVKFAIILNQSKNNKPHILKMLVKALF